MLNKISFILFKIIVIDISILFKKLRRSQLDFELLPPSHLQYLFVSNSTNKI